jgi:hypothetical protein
MLQKHHKPTGHNGHGPLLSGLAGAGAGAGTGALLSLILHKDPAAMMALGLAGGGIGGALYGSGAGDQAAEEVLAPPTAMPQDVQPYQPKPFSGWHPKKANIMNVRAMAKQAAAELVKKANPGYIDPRMAGLAGATGGAAIGLPVGVLASVIRTALKDKEKRHWGQDAIIGGLEGAGIGAGAGGMFGLGAGAGYDIGLGGPIKKAAQEPIHLPGRVDVAPGAADSIKFMAGAGGLAGAVPGVGIAALITALQHKDKRHWMRNLALGAGIGGGTGALLGGGAAVGLNGLLGGISEHKDPSTPIGHASAAKPEPGHKPTGFHMKPMDLDRDVPNIGGRPYMAGDEPMYEDSKGKPTDLEHQDQSTRRTQGREGQSWHRPIDVSPGQHPILEAMKMTNNGLQNLNRFLRQQFPETQPSTQPAK